MKKRNVVPLFVVVLLIFASGCEERRIENTTASDEQSMTEQNQQALLKNQPPPKLTFSMERENLIKRFNLMNDRAVFFYMYIFNEGIADPIGYYQVNKVSSVNSQLTNPEQIISGLRSGNDLPSGTAIAIPSPAEDGSYGTNGDAVFGFTPEDIYIEHNMHYIVSTVPLTFKSPVVKLAVINAQTEEQIRSLMQRLSKR